MNFKCVDNPIETGIRSDMEKKNNKEELSFKAAPFEVERKPRDFVLEYAKSLQEWQERSLRSKKRLGCSTLPLNKS